MSDLRRLGELLAGRAGDDMERQLQDIMLGGASTADHAESPAPTADEVLDGIRRAVRLLDPPLGDLCELCYTSADMPAFGEGKVYVMDRSKVFFCPDGVRRPGPRWAVVLPAPEELGW